MCDTSTARATFGFQTASCRNSMLSPRFLCSDPKRVPLALIRTFAGPTVFQPEVVRVAVVSVYQVVLLQVFTGSPPEADVHEKKSPTPHDHLQ